MANRKGIANYNQMYCIINRLMMNCKKVFNFVKSLFLVGFSSYIVHYLVLWVTKKQNFQILEVILQYIT